MLSMNPKYPAIFLFALTPTVGLAAEFKLSESVKIGSTFAATPLEANQATMALLPGQIIGEVLEPSSRYKGEHYALGEGGLELYESIKRVEGIPQILNKAPHGNGGLYIRSLRIAIGRGSETVIHDFHTESEGELVTHTSKILRQRNLHDVATIMIVPDYATADKNDAGIYV